jgi:hypothetical protein
MFGYNVHFVISSTLQLKHVQENQNDFTSFNMDLLITSAHLPNTLKV